MIFHYDKHEKREVREVLSNFKFLFSIIAILLLLPLASAFEQNFTLPTIEPTGANVQAVSFKYEPYPVEPGEQFELWVKVQNIGEHDATAARCRLDIDYPFSLYQGDLEKSLGVLGTGEFAIMTYKLKVDENAADGDNEITFQCTDSVGGKWKVKLLTVRVQTRYQTLNVVDVRTVPDFIEPGKSGQLFFTLENRADSSMKDIKIKIDFSSVPLAPLGGIGEQKLRRINSSSSADISFNLTALPEASGGVYKVPVLLSYTDDLGTAYSVNGTVIVEINSKPDLEIIVDSTTITTNNKLGEVVFKVINKGLTNIKFFNLKLLESRQYKIISADKVYIGDVDSDDSETAEFRISAKANKITFPLEIEYKDASNNAYSDKVNVTFALASNSEMGIAGGVNWIIIIIILAVAAFVVYKKRRKIFPKL